MEWWGWRPTVRRSVERSRRPHHREPWLPHGGKRFPAEVRADTFQDLNCGLSDWNFHLKSVKSEWLKQFTRRYCSVLWKIVLQSPRGSLILGSVLIFRWVLGNDKALFTDVMENWSFGLQFTMISREPEIAGNCPKACHSTGTLWT